MKFNSFIDVLGGVVIVAMITAAVSSRNTASQITAAANGFGDVLASALGKGSVA